MKSEKYHLYLTASELSLLVRSLVDLKNALLLQGRYAQRFEERFYQGNTPEADTIPPMPKFESSTELPEAVPIESDKKDETATDTQADTELITKLLSNPETAALLKALASKL